MNTHQFLKAADENGWLVSIDTPVSPDLELAAVAYALDGLIDLVCGVEAPERETD